ncbi:MAG: hypothetical protein IJ773_14155 [Lachnospiraceae bacterium]|nr:hypothetical protein [Lachnospiraceae bacterium]
MLGEQAEKPVLKRTVKDSVFSEIFTIPAYQVELLQALYPDAENITEQDIQNVTIRNIVSVDVYNDLGLLFRDTLVVLMEAQSVMTPNILVRFIEYIARTYKDHILRTGQNWYSRSKVSVPIVDLYVIYVGDRSDVKDGSVISLTDEFFHGVPCGIEVRAKVISRPQGNDALSQYLRFADISNQTVSEKGRTREAAEQIVKKCIDRGILPEFFELRKQEVIAAMVELFSQQEADEMRESSYLFGEQRARNEGKRDAYIGLVAAGLLSLRDGAKWAGMEENDFYSRLIQIYPHFRSQQ